MVTDILKIEPWHQADQGLLTMLPDNVQNFVCQLKEQEKYVEAAQLLTSIMEQSQIEEEPKNDAERRRQAMKERLKRKLAARQ